MTNGLLGDHWRGVSRVNQCSLVAQMCLCVKESAHLKQCIMGRFIAAKLIGNFNNFDDKIKTHVP